VIGGGSVTIGLNNAYLSGALGFGATGSISASSTSAVSIVPAVAGSTSLVANTFAVAGQQAMLTASGTISTPTAYASTLSLVLGIGGATLSTGTITPITNTTNAPWSISCPLAVYAVGTNSGVLATSCTVLGISSGALALPGFVGTFSG